MRHVKYVNPRQVYFTSAWSDSFIEQNVLEGDWISFKTGAFRHNLTLLNCIHDEGRHSHDVGCVTDNLPIRTIDTLEVLAADCSRLTLNVSSLGSAIVKWNSPKTALFDGVR
jgi:hypothetical protein